MSVQTSKLPNGMTVLTDHMPHLQTCSVGVWVDAGARCEAPSQHGISHMLEHMAFKGTERRSALRIAEEIENAGGHLNAHTTHETTAYYARILKDDMGLALDILADILQHSTFEADELARERDVIIQEIGQALDTPDDLVFDEMLQAAYPDQALGRSILGTAGSVKALGRENLSGYMASHYKAPNMVLAAAGAVDHEQLVDQASGLFATLQAGPGGPCGTAQFRGGNRRLTQDLEQVHLALAFEGVPYGDPDYYAAQLFAGVLGGGMSSRLFQEVREKRGLAYSVFGFSWSFNDTGLTGIYAGAAPERFCDLVPVLADEMARMGVDVSDEETDRAKAQVKAGLLMSLESSSSRAEQIARQQMIYGRIVPVEEIIAKVDAVDAKALRRYAGRILSGPAPAIATVGALDGLEKEDRIAARFGH